MRAARTTIATKRHVSAHARSLSTEHLTALLPLTLELLTNATVTAVGGNHLS